MFLPHRSPGQDRFGVLIAIPELWITQLTELHLSLDDLQDSRASAHITILPPTPSPIEERPEVICHPREVIKHYSPFRVTLKGSDSFRLLSQVASLPLSEGAAECANLADEVRTGPLDTEQRFPYHPHVTLVWDVDDPALDLALDLGANFGVSWLAPDFRLDRVDENGMYSTVVLFDFEASST